MLVSHKVIGSLLAMVSIACIAILIIGSLGKDKNPPEISFSEENEITYKEGEPERILLEDVTAFDEEDGEVTDNLVIESVYDFNNGSAKVVYVARDNAGNITKAERMVNYEKAETDGVTSSAIETGATGEEIDAFGDGSSTSGEGTEATTRKSSDTDAENDEPLVPNGEKPVLRLTTSKVVVKKGDKSFNKLSYVDEIVDDKDDRTQLFRRIIVKGTYDLNTTGTYQLQYYVTDSDGNLSDIQTLTLVVEDTP